MEVRGYISHIMQGVRSVPQSVQQLVIRNYCEKNGFKFLLSATEFEDQTIMFDSIKEKNIIFYSIWILPKSKEKRKKIYDSGKNIKFATENLNLDIEFLETVFTIGEWHGSSQFCDTITYLKQA